MTKQHTNITCDTCNAPSHQTLVMLTVNAFKRQSQVKFKSSQPLPAKTPPIQPQSHPVSDGHLVITAAPPPAVEPSARPTGRLTQSTTTFSAIAMVIVFQSRCRVLRTVTVTARSSPKAHET
jgi:type IV secretory pathway protease TraF